MRKTLWFRCSAALAAFALLPVGLTQAQVVPVSNTPQIGSSNPITAEPSVTRPSTTPCVVQLFSNLAFADFTPKVFNYAPPANCPGPWAKVVFTADFTVTAGRQFDRTAAFYLGHANIYYGTTAEPRSNLSPSWHVERDVTDLSAIFNSDQTGEANIGNFVGVSGGVTYNGIIYANAALEFYPTAPNNPAPRVPDMVVAVNGSGGDAGTLNTGSDQITQTLNLPTNVENVYLDVISQSQINDEFWYTCVPNDEANNLFTCGGTAFRETEVSIDGKPAGVAPVYPWIFTGGIDPFLWEPIPGVQTLDFRPYRVDLTPFAGLLSDGNQHTVAVSVYNANSYFLATANLLVFTDHGTQRTSGGILVNTLSAAPSPSINENISFNSSNGQYTGSVDTSSNRNFIIRGFLNTSHGRVETTVQETVGFTNNQQFDVNPNTADPDDQNIEQTTTVTSRSTTEGGGPFQYVHDQQFTYPLIVDFALIENPDGSFSQTTKVNQQFLLNTQDHTNGAAVYTSSVNNHVQSQDTLAVDSSGNLSLTPTSNQSYTFQDSKGACYSRTLTSSNNVLTNVTNGCQ